MATTETTDYVRVLDSYFLIDKVLFVETNEGYETKKPVPYPGKATYTIILSFTFSGGIQKTVTYTAVGDNGQFQGDVTYTLSSLWDEIKFQIGIKQSSKSSAFPLDLSSPSLGLKS